MATNATPVPPISPENLRNGPSSTTSIKQEQELLNTTANAVNAPPQPLAEAPPYFTSLAELRNLHTAMSVFFHCHDDLQRHLDSIKTAIDSNLPDHLNQFALNSIPETSPKPSLPEPDNPFTKPDIKFNSESNPAKPTRSELEIMCESMCGKSLRKCIVSRLSDSTEQLLTEIPKALKLAANPPKLVLECIGRYYVQGRKAYHNNQNLNNIRRASNLLLECFLLMDCQDIVIDSLVEDEAVKAAVTWKKRIKAEGGFQKAIAVDAKGLLMLISGFGIPNVFSNEVIRDLIIAAKVRRNASALRKSIYIVPRIPAIIELMVKNNLEVEAANIAYIFGLEDKCSPQKILSTFLNHTMKSKIQGSLEEVKTAKEKQLAALKPVILCLEAHNINPSEMFPESNIDEKITSLEKEIAELDKKVKENATAKRKTETNSPQNKSEDVKRSRFTCPIDGHGGGINSYNGVRITNNSLDERLIHGNYINDFSSFPILPPGSILPRDGMGSIPGGARLLNPNPRVYGQHSEVNSIGEILGRGDVTLNERLMAQDYACQNHATPSHEDTTIRERLLSQSYAGQIYASQPSSYGLTSLYMSSHSSLEGFVGVPQPPSSAGPWTRVSGSDLYGFADSIPDTK